jgi:hypothetical protein
VNKVISDISYFAMQFAVLILFVPVTALAKPFCNLANLA